MRVISLVLLLCLAAEADAALIHVPGESGFTIQEGIDAASYGDTVLVDCGTYHEHSITMKSGIRLVSATGEPDCVIVDAQQLGRVLWCQDLDELTSIEGLTLTGGLASSPEANGGAVLLRAASPTLIRCDLTGNSAGNSGGAVWCDTGSAPVFLDCRLLGNSALGSHGGALCCWEGTAVQLTNCELSDNTAARFGGAVLAFYETTAEFIDCTFERNASLQYDGGAIFADWDASVSLVDCVLSANESHEDGGAIASSFATVDLVRCALLSNSSGDMGGAIGCFAYSALSSTDCVFAENESVSHGGAVCCHNASAVLSGCTLAYNSISEYGWGTGLWCWMSSVDVNRSVLAYNSFGPAVWCNNDDCDITLTCTDVYGHVNGDWVGCISGQSGIEGNLSADPLFCGPGVTDLALCANSPCLPDANECGVLIGALGEGCGPCGTLVKPGSWSAIKCLYRQGGSHEPN